MDYNPVLPEVQANPYPYYSALRRNNPVAWLEPLQCWAVSRYEDVDYALLSLYRSLPESMSIDERNFGNNGHSRKASPVCLESLAYRRDLVTLFDPDLPQFVSDLQVHIVPCELPLSAELPKIKSRIHDHRNGHHQG